MIDFFRVADDCDTVLIAAGWGLCIFRRVVGRQYNPLGLKMIIFAQADDTVLDFARHRATDAAIDAACVAWVIWLWWNDGGGDQMRKRLSRLKQRLSIRQPAPQGA